MDRAVEVLAQVLVNAETGEAALAPQKSLVGGSAQAQCGIVHKTFTNRRLLSVANTGD